MRWPRNVIAVMLFSTATSYASSGGQAVLYMFFNEQMGWGSSYATAAVSFYVCIMNVFAVAGALASDHWLGKLRTQIVSNSIWTVGTIVLLIAVLPTDDKTLASAWVTIIALFGVTLVAFGSGAMSPSLSAFVGDQATSLADVSVFFSWYYFFMNVGSLLGEGGCPLMRQHVSFAATYGTIMASMVIAFAVFWWGYGTYVRRDEGVPSPGRLTCQCSPVVSHYSAEDRAGLWRVLKIFAPLPAYWALFFQQNSSWITQTAQMDTTLIWHTSDVLASLEDLFVCIFVPLFASCLYPALERFPRLNPTPLRKMGFGMACTCLAFVCAALVQMLIDRSAPHSVSVAWQLPQWVLIAIAETTVAVTGLEFAFTQCGPNTRSLVQALWTLMQLGQFLTGVIAGMKIGTLEQDFWFYSGLMAVFTLVFVAITLTYQYNDRTGLEGDAKDALAGKHVRLDGDLDDSTSAGGSGSGATPQSLAGARSPSLPPPGGHTERDALLDSDVRLPQVP